MLDTSPPLLRMGPTDRRGTAARHTACSSVTRQTEQCTDGRAANTALSLPVGYLTAQGGTSHSSAMSVARSAAPSCLPRQRRVLQCQPSCQQLSWGMQEEFFRREGAHRGGGQLVSPPTRVGRWLWGQPPPRKCEMRMPQVSLRARASYQPGRLPKEPRTGDAQDLAQEGSLGHTCALGTHFPTGSSEVSMQMCTCTGRGDTSVTPWISRTWPKAGPEPWWMNVSYSGGL